MTLPRLLATIAALCACTPFACSGDDTDTSAQSASAGGHGGHGGAGGAESSATGSGGCACDVTDGSRTATIDCGDMTCVNGHVYACSGDEMLSKTGDCTGSASAGGGHM